MFLPMLYMYVNPVVFLHKVHCILLKHDMRTHTESSIFFESK